MDGVQPSGGRQTLDKGLTVINMSYNETNFTSLLRKVRVYGSEYLITRLRQIHPEQRIAVLLAWQYLTPST